METVDQFLKFPRIWQIALVFFAVIYLTIMGMVAVAGGAYQQVTIIDSDFNKTVNLWYHIFVPHHLKSLTPDTWQCNPSLIAIDELVSTSSSAFYSYEMNGFFDPASGNQIDGLSYFNSPLQNCTAQSISVYFPSNIVDSLSATVNMMCNTTSGQSVYFSYNPSQDSGVSDSVLLQRFGAATSFQAPYNISSVVLWWVLTLENLFYTSASEVLNLGNDTLSPSYLQFNAMNSDGTLNSPALGNWTISIINKKTNQNTPVAFLPTGEVDNTKTPVVNLSAFLGTFPAADETEFWTMINWIFVSLFWTTLYDVGQIQPTCYGPIPDNATNQFFFNPQSLPSTYNIFDNEELFSSYSAFLRNNVLTLPDLNYTLPAFQPINATNQLQEQSITFLRSYSCTLRTLKQPIDMAVGLMTAYWVFLQAGWTGAGVIIGFIFAYRRHIPGYTEVPQPFKLEASHSLTTLPGKEETPVVAATAVPPSRVDEGVGD